MSTRLQTVIGLIAVCKEIAVLLKSHLYIHSTLVQCGDSWSFFGVGTTFVAATKNTKVH